MVDLERSSPTSKFSTHHSQRTIMVTRVKQASTRMHLLVVAALVAPSLSLPAIVVEEISGILVLSAVVPSTVPLKPCVNLSATTPPIFP